MWGHFSKPSQNNYCLVCRLTTSFESYVEQGLNTFWGIYINYAVQPLVEHVRSIAMARPTISSRDLLIKIVFVEYIANADRRRNRVIKYNLCMCYGSIFIFWWFHWILGILDSTLSSYQTTLHTSNPLGRKLFKIDKFSFSRAMFFCRSDFPRASHAVQIYVGSYGS